MCVCLSVSTCLIVTWIRKERRGVGLIYALPQVGSEELRQTFERYFLVYLLLLLLLVVLQFFDTYCSSCCFLFSA